jgi:hypothetical protein
MDPHLGRPGVNARTIGRTPIRARVIVRCQARLDGPNVVDMNGNEPINQIASFSASGPRGSLVSPQDRGAGRLSRPRHKVLRAMASAVAVGAGMTAVAVPSAAQADQPLRLSIDISEESVSDFWSEACGTEVVISITGTMEATLWRNEEGLVVREIDRFPGSFFTFSAPETGKSVKSRADLVSRWTYPGGAVLGGPVEFEFHGMFFHIPGGTSAFAGREVSRGDVAGFDGSLPVVDDGELVSLVGHFPDVDFVSAVCGQLT